ncbi:MAG: membrane protein insertase YidC [Crocinitomicaceae bacterium]|nr:membrane protein insertase YidC [Crocinitomicaceae bacterium]
MDKNTLIGLGLIGTLLVTFTFLNRPKELTDAIDNKGKTEISASTDSKKDDSKSAVAENNANSNKTVSSEIKTANTGVKTAQTGETIRFETDKIIYDFSTKGGVLSAVYLKEYQTYNNFAKKKEKLVPLRLFGEGDNVNELSFPLNGQKFKTGNKLFSVVDSSSNRIVFELKPSDKQSIQFVYTLKEGVYDMDFEVKMKGFEGAVSAENVMLNWKTNLRKTERLLSAERMVSTVCFKNKGKDHDYLSETSDDDENMEAPVEWVAFKQSYFSTIMKPAGGFGQAGSKLKVRTYKEGDPEYSSHIKKYIAVMNLDLSNTGDASAKINWFFGPNDFDVLKSYNAGYEDNINFGWGIFRWMNVYAIQPLFNLLESTGLAVGIVILLLTAIIKLLLMPIQWKMYVSSAKMRILKPEVDELNAKFPNKEDAMKKQVEMMSLYKTSGASPLAGCVPMLIQMPILLAIFRFFPAVFELRQKSFLWAEDLSSYDSIYDFGFYIPMYGDHISLFTLLMAITTLVYTWLNSGNMQQPTQPGMPNMKVIMYIFPFMMIFFFNNYSAGLSYYYFISTLSSIIIMVAIKQFFVDEEKLKEKMAAKKEAAVAKGPKAKSKFQERLEQMQKAQVEAQKNKKK